MSPEEWAEEKLRLQRSALDDVFVALRALQDARRKTDYATELPWSLVEALRYVCDARDDIRRNLAKTGEWA